MKWNKSTHDQVFFQKLFRFKLWLKRLLKILIQINSWPKRETLRFESTHELISWWIVNQWINHHESRSNHEPIKNKLINRIGKRIHNHICCELINSNHSSSGSPVSSCGRRFRARPVGISRRHGSRWHGGHWRWGGEGYLDAGIALNSSDAASGKYQQVSHEMFLIVYVLL